MYDLFFCILENDGALGWTKTPEDVNTWTYFHLKTVHHRVIRTVGMTQGSLWPTKVGNSADQYWP